MDDAGQIFWVHFFNQPFAHEHRLLSITFALILHAQALCQQPFKLGAVHTLPPSQISVIIWAHGSRSEEVVDPAACWLGWSTLLKLEASIGIGVGDSGVRVTPTVAVGLRAAIRKLETLAAGA